MEQNKQQPCSLPQKAGASSWLKGYARNAEMEIAWIHLERPYIEKSRLGRGLAGSNIKMHRCIPYDDGSSAVLVRGPKEEIKRIVRLSEMNSFVQEQVKKVWVGALPIPRELLELSPIWQDRCIQIFASEPASGAKKPSLLDIVSVDAGISLEHAAREPVAVGVSAHLVGSGRIEGLVAVEVLHEIGELPSKERGDFVKYVEIAPRMNARGSLPKGVVDKLQIMIEESSVDQLRPIWDAVGSLADSSLSLCASELCPMPGRVLGASVDIAMKRQSDESRANIEQMVRKICNDIGAEVGVSWQFEVQRS